MSKSFSSSDEEEHGSDQHAARYVDIMIFNYNNEYEKYKTNYKTTNDVNRPEHAN